MKVNGNNISNSSEMIEMLNCPKFMQKADDFFNKEPQCGKELTQYFLEKVNVESELLPPSYSIDNLIDLAHKVYAIYRAEIIEKACDEVETDLANWAFNNVQDWENKKDAFKDLMWVHSAVFSGDAEQTIALIMREKFTCLSPNFWPELTSIRHPKPITA